MRLMVMPDGTGLRNLKRSELREPTVPEVLAWLQEQNVGEEVEAFVFEDEEFGEWHRVLHVESYDVIWSSRWTRRRDHEH